MGKFLFYAHGGSNNRGCEAIVRGTQAIINSIAKNNEITICSSDPSSDIAVNLDKEMTVIGRVKVVRFTLTWILLNLYRIIMKDPMSMAQITSRKEITVCRLMDACFSIGGDNYCSDKLYYLYAIDNAVKKNGSKLVLWGCSIEPRDILNDKEMCKDLALFDLITTRESITYNALIKAGINKNVYLHADPGFIMEKEIVPFPNGWPEGKIVGINLSPYVLKYQGENSNLMDSSIALVQHILDNPSYNVVLIPHVTQPNNNDWEILKILYDKFKKTERILLVGQEYNSPQIKYLISNCKLFIGARTHATIAAYSTCVPTLALGYSVKAKGIARDIFGSEEGLVLPIQEIEDEQQLIKAFDLLCEREDKLRECLINYMPRYIQSAWNAGEHVKKLLEE
jgi:colanic acid/amylovoran biosynthesis protein